LHFIFFFLLTPRPHSSTLFPYTTLFRSVLDATDLAQIKPLSIYEVSELDSPWSRATPGRFGAHQFQEHMDDTLVYCAWFAGGLRSEEHTSELQSRRDLVCRLLLEKKKRR